MKLFIAFLVWCLLLVVAWPLAVLVLLALPVLWVISIPLRLVWWCVAAALALAKALLFLPARILGFRGAA